MYFKPKHLVVAAAASENRCVCDDGDSTQQAQSVPVLAW